jgi:hypothetical protein
LATQLADVQASENENELAEAYVRRWFVSFETLVRRSGGTAEQIEALIAAGAAPGPIYAQFPDGVWWSPITTRGEAGRTPPAGSTGWYTTGALYWLRRALLGVREGASPVEAAERNREAFLDQFVEALKVEPLASGSYPDAFPGDEINLVSARKIGESEWESWRTGGFGVCLRSFTGTTCVTKESIGKKLKAELAGGERTLSDFELIDLVERLASVMLPFAPFERPVCTPGCTIDPALELLKLGCEEPYGAED